MERYSAMDAFLYDCHNHQLNTCLEQKVLFVSLQSDTLSKVVNITNLLSSPPPSASPLTCVMHLFLQPNSKLVLRMKLIQYQVQFEICSRQFYISFNAVNFRGSGLIVKRKVKKRRTQNPLLQLPDDISTSLCVRISLADANDPCFSKLSVNGNGGKRQYYCTCWLCSSVHS